tara:strand:- start:407 stop:691 length:285 start_codon:yes stop_codon:yes gene_type:complete
MIIFLLQPFHHPMLDSSAQQQSLFVLSTFSSSFSLPLPSFYNYFILQLPFFFLTEADADKTTFYFINTSMNKKNSMRKKRNPKSRPLSSFNKSQ